MRLGVSVPLRHLLVLGLAAGLATLPTLGETANGFELITAAEAALPSIPPPALAMRGSPMRRPHIEVVSPLPRAGLIHSPIDLIVRFQAFGGSKINVNSILVTYLKQPSIDLTQRLKPFITATGINVAKADVPPGWHQLWIELKDAHGYVGGAELTFQIAK